MVDVYYYIPAGDAENAVECGLKLSSWFDREVVIGNESRRCISALLNPKDDKDKYKSQDYKCLKLELSPGYCYAADRHLYLVGQNYPEAMEMYLKSVIPVEKYIFGSYRLPECLVTSTVLAGQISVLGKRLDLPVLFDSSEELYINNIIEAFRDRHHNFNDVLLYYFYCKLAEIQKVDKIEDKEHNIAVFIDKSSGETMSIKIPEITVY